MFSKPPNAELLKWFHIHFKASMSEPCPILSVAYPLLRWWVEGWTLYCLWLWILSINMASLWCVALWLNTNLDATVKVFFRYEHLNQQTCSKLVGLIQSVRGLKRNTELPREGRYSASRLPLAQDYNIDSCQNFQPDCPVLQIIQICQPPQSHELTS